MATARHLEVAEAGDGDTLRHIPAASLALGQCAEGRQVGHRHDRIHIGPLRHEQSHRFSALLHRDRRLAERNDAAGGELELADCICITTPAVGTARVAVRCAADECDVAIALAVQMPHQCTAGLRVREADRMFYRVLRQVPSLDHRNAGGAQRRSRRRGVTAACKDHALGPAHQHGLDQPFFVVDAVVGITQQQLKAAAFHRFGNAVGSVREV